MCILGLLYNVRQYFNSIFQIEIVYQLRFSHLFWGKYEKWDHQGTQTWSCLKSNYMTAFYFLFSGMLQTSRQRKRERMGL